MERRDFMKVVGAGIAALYFEKTGIAKALGGVENLPNIETGGIKEGEYYVPMATKVLIMPINKGGMYDDTGASARLPRAVNLIGGVTLQARNLQTVEVNGIKFKVAEIPFAGGDIPRVVDLGIPANTDQSLAFAILEASDKAFYTRAEALSSYTGIWRESANPAKAWNILEAARNLAEYQEAHDGFGDGEYSFLDIQKHLGDPNFRQAYNLNWNLVRGGGIDAVATVLSKSLLPLTQSGKASYKERSPNPENFEYFQNQTDPATTELKSDAKIIIDSNGRVRNDFSWRFSGVGKVYLNIGVSVIPDKDSWQTGGSWTRFPGDRLVLSLTWTGTKPAVKQSEAIARLMVDYGKYRAEGPGSAALGSLLQNGSEESYGWKEAKVVSEKVRPELDTRDFKAEIDGSDAGMAKANIAEFLLKKDIKPSDVQKFNIALIYYLRDVTNEFNISFPYTAADAKEGKPRPKQRLGTFLISKMQADGILLPLTQVLPGLTGAASELDNNTYLRGDQSIQCLIFVSFLGRINLPVSPLYVGGTDAATASGLVNPFVRNALKFVDRAADPKHAELRFARVRKVEDVMVGDSFVRWGGDNNHIGTVIGKKIVGGSTVLLVADANRKNDGVVRVFEVRKDNFKLIFGEPDGDLFPVVIRNDDVEKFLGK